MRFHCFSVFSQASCRFERPVANALEQFKQLKPTHEMFDSCRNCGALQEGHENASLLLSALLECQGPLAGQIHVKLRAPRLIIRVDDTGLDPLRHRRLDLRPFPPLIPRCHSNEGHLHFQGSPPQLLVVRPIRPRAAVARVLGSQGGVVIPRSHAWAKQEPVLLCRSLQMRPVVGGAAVTEPISAKVRVETIEVSGDNEVLHVRPFHQYTQHYRVVGGDPRLASPSGARCCVHSAAAVW